MEEAKQVHRVSHDIAQLSANLLALITQTLNQAGIATEAIAALLPAVTADVFRRHAHG